jgi:hypothetical protein
MRLPFIFVRRISKVIVFDIAIAIIILLVMVMLMASANLKHTFISDGTMVMVTIGGGGSHQSKAPTLLGIVFKSFRHPLNKKSFQPTQQFNPTHRVISQEPLEATGGHRRPRGPQEATGSHRRPQEATGGHRRPQEATGGHRRPQEATGGHRRPQEATRVNKLLNQASHCPAAEGLAELVLGLWAKIIKNQAI